MRVINLSGTNFGEESDVYKALASVVYDTNQSLRRIASIWIGFVNFNEMSDHQFDEIKLETKIRLKQIDELSGCLDDVLIHAYNRYISKPLKLNKRQIDMSDKRRYIAEDGRIIDNRDSSFSDQ